MYDNDNNSYGQWNGNTTSQNTNSNPYGGYNSNYSYGQNGYSYNQNGHPSYGTYQYNQNGQGPVTPPENGGKKKHTAAKVVAAICILALLVGGVGFAYTTVARRLGSAAPAEQAIEESTEQNVAQEDTQAKLQSRLCHGGCQRKDVGHHTAHVHGLQVVLNLVLCSQRVDGFDEARQDEYDSQDDPADVDEALFHSVSFISPNTA